MISFIFFQKGKVDWIERVALSFALSIAVVPLAVFYLNLVGMRISLLSSSLTVLGIVAVSGVVLWLKDRIVRQRTAKPDKCAKTKEKA